MLVTVARDHLRKFSRIAALELADGISAADGRRSDRPQRTVAAYPVRPLHEERRLFAIRPKARGRATIGNRAAIVEPADLPSGAHPDTRETTGRAWRTQGRSSLVH